MKHQLSDTDTEIERVLIDLFRKTTAAQKFSRVRSLSQTVMQLSHRGIVRANKGISDKDADILFVQLHYGSDLASKLSKYLDSHESV